MPTPAQPNTIQAEYLFGEYFSTIQKYFQRIKSFRSEDGQQLNLIVAYGTPAAAYRKELEAVSSLIQQQKLPETFNGKARLPFMNFFAPNWKRKLGKEPIRKPYTIRYEEDKEKYLKTIVPFIFDVTINCSLWTANYRERDDLIYKIYSMFPRNEISLPHIPNKTDPYHSGSLINITFNEDMSDTTEIEGLDERETRDVIRTDWTMQTELTVAREGYYVDVIKKVGFDSTVMSEIDPTNNPDDGIMYTITKDIDDNFIHTPSEYP